MQYLPWVIISSAACSVVALFIYTAFADRVSNTRLLIGILAISGAGILLGLAALAAGLVGPAYLLLFLVLQVPLLDVYNVHWATYVNGFYDIRTAKRIVPVLSTVRPPGRHHRRAEHAADEPPVQPGRHHRGLAAQPGGHGHPGGCHAALAARTATRWPQPDAELRASSAQLPTRRSPAACGPGVTICPRVWRQPARRLSADRAFAFPALDGALDALHDPPDDPAQLRGQRHLPGGASRPRLRSPTSWEC